MFDLILRYGAFSPAKIIYKGFTRTLWKRLYPD